MRVLLYNIHSEKSLFNLKNSFFVCIVCIAMGSKKNVLLIQTNCLVDVLFWIEHMISVLKKIMLWIQKNYFLTLSNVLLSKECFIQMH